MPSSLVVLLAGFVVAVVMTPAGISGAFLLVPFQTSVLGATTVSVTPTNLVFNLVATPMAIAVFRRKGRLDGRLAALVTSGSLPGVLLGVWIRIAWLSDPARFRMVVGLVLLLLAASLLASRRTPEAEAGVGRDRATDALVVGASVVTGVLGGVYGVGGGAFLAPFLVLATGASLRQIAGATLVGTWTTSLAGIAAFSLVARQPGNAAVAPDWTVGLLLGLGGAVGGLVGAHLQARVPERALRTLLALVVAGLGAFYASR